MNVQDMIFEELKHLRTKVDDISLDVAVLNDKHDNGNRSERLAAGTSLLAVLISIVAMICTLNSCSGTYNPEKPCYQFTACIPKVVPHARKIPPIDLAKEKLTIDAYNKISVGTGIAVAALLAGMFFSNPLVNKLSSCFLFGGGSWALIGLNKIFVAEYLPWLIWIAAIAVCGCIIYRVRNRSITKSWSWLCSLTKSK